MKKILRTSVVFILAAFMMAGCSKNTPKDVAYNWLTDFNHLDFDAAKKLSTADTKNLLSSLQQLTEKVTDSNKKELKKVTITIKDVKENGDKAVATYISSDNPAKNQTLNLVKQGNKWLVQFSKVDLMAEVPGADNDATMSPDTTGAATGAPQDTTMSADTSRHSVGKRLKS